MPKAKTKPKKSSPKRATKKPAREPASKPARNEAVEALFRKANKAIEANKLDVAIALITEAMKLEPKNAALVQSRGAVRAMKEDPKGAIRDYEKALALEPRYADAHLNCGLAYTELGQQQAAEKHLTKALEAGLALEELIVQAHYFRAVARQQLGNLRGAIDDYNQVVVLVPGTNPAEQSAMRAIELMQRLEHKRGR